jgi:Zn-dependent protease
MPFEPLTAVVGLVVFIISVTLHEASHALVAMLGGDPTAYQGGQVTLDPIPHIKREPVGMVVIPLISTFVFGLPMGYASAPFNPGWAVAFPKRAALMALAGPGANLLLTVLAFAAMWVGVSIGWFEPPGRLTFGHVVGPTGGGFVNALGVFLSVTFSLNLLLCLFNLIPVPPLDGATAVPLFLSDDAAKRWFQMIWKPGGIGTYGIFIAWFLIGRIFQPVWQAAAELLHPGTVYVPIVG